MFYELEIFFPVLLLNIYVFRSWAKNTTVDTLLGERGTSVSRFQEKEKRGEMITINDNIK
jgi:hypothetical protein